MQDMMDNTALSDAEVRDFLRNHPAFFERNASLLAEIYLPSPHGNGAISLTERQQLAQRDKIRASEALIADIIAFGKQNDVISQKMHLFSLALLTHSDFVDIPHIVTHHMQQAFAVEYAKMHLWADSKLSPSHAAFAQLSDDFKQWAMTLNTPYCGEKPALATNIDANIAGDNALTDDAWKQAQSIACIPLYAPSHTETTPNMIGVVLLAAADAAHFKADMGTVFLQRMGDLIGAALTKHLIA